MDYEHANNVIITKSRVISRNSSLNCSSRVFYCRPAGQGIPFQWEMLPGTPKESPKEDLLPPLSPPPAVVSLGLPKPCIHEIEEEPQKVISIRLSLKFWKYIKKIRSIKKVYYGSRRNNIHDININNNSNNSISGSDESKFEFCSSDIEFMASPPRNSVCSSSSTSTSLSNDHSKRLSAGTMSLRRDSIQDIHGCGPWNFSSRFVRT